MRGAWPSQLERLPGLGETPTELSVYSLSASNLCPAEVVALSKRCGAAGVEWWCRDQGHIDLSNLVPTAREAARLTRDAGLEVAGLAPYFKLDPMDYVKRLFEAAKVLGARHVRCHTLGYPGDASYRELMRRFRAWLEPLIELCAQLDLKLVLEQHHYSIGCTPNACLELVDGLPPAHVGVIYDPGNALWEGWTSPQYAVDVLGEYLAHVHVKSCRAKPGAPGLPRGRTVPIDGVALKDGDIDWADVLKWLRTANYQGWLSLEALDGRPSEQKISEDVPFLMGLLEKL